MTTAMLIDGMPRELGGRQGWAMKIEIDSDGESVRSILSRLFPDVDPDSDLIRVRVGQPGGRAGGEKQTVDYLVRQDDRLILTWAVVQAN